MAQSTVQHVETSGTFSLDGGTWDVDNNVWVVGDAQGCVVIDPAHDVDAVAELVGSRTVEKILLTHAHDDHAGLAVEAAERFGAPVFLHAEEQPLWKLTHGEPAPSFQRLTDGYEISVGDATLTAIHTPGHSPGSVCFYSEDLQWNGKSPVLFSGDTLFQGGPGATGRSYSDFPTIIASISDRLLMLPEQTVVLTGHGPSTTIGDEAPHRQEWIDRGE
ncbi:MBL fold metallo-hydrolase [Rothia uropygioeca]|uniref:MBL fold metallo-hydrolase n=1 Tax=Kocuria sp. 257 TaxID=2021970 RepID=UPI0010115A62|nr:MBL fold metallo-hydrolase [Kocuria sp. 257]